MIGTKRQARYPPLAARSAVSANWRDMWRMSPRWTTSPFNTLAALANPGDSGTPSLTLAIHAAGMLRVVTRRIRAPLTWNTDIASA